MPLLQWKLMTTCHCSSYTMECRNMMVLPYTVRTPSSPTSMCVQINHQPKMFSPRKVCSCNCAIESSKQDSGIYSYKLGNGPPTEKWEIRFSHLLWNNKMSLSKCHALQVANLHGKLQNRQTQLPIGLAQLGRRLCIFLALRQKCVFFYFVLNIFNEFKE